MSFLLPLLFAVLEGDDADDLIRRLKARDPDALAVLYDRYGRIVYSLIYRVVRNEGIAEDLTQETFLRVWNRVQGFDGEKGRLGPWLLAIARNRAIDYIRSVDGRMNQSSFELAASETPSFFVNIEQEVLNSDRGRRLRAAFETLNAQQRQVIELAYYEGLTQSEMADKLGQPLGTVKTWVRSALIALRRHIGPEMAL